MTYKYMQVLSTPPISTGCTIINGFQAYIDDQFYNAPDSYVIGEEAVFSSGSFINVEVRINRAINIYTGDKLGDDFKTVIFKDIAHATGIGMKYRFDNNDWIVSNTEILKNFAASCTIRRCNNVLRWTDPIGNIQQEPCVIDYMIKRPVDQVGTSDLVQANGFIEILCQLNEGTRTIQDGQRFLFGNVDRWVCYKALGGGIKNYMNLETYNNDSTHLLTMNVVISQVNPDTDDLTLGIADRYKIETPWSNLP
jgi:hypothetical protein